MPINGHFDPDFGRDHGVNPTPMGGGGGGGIFIAIVVLLVLGAVAYFGFAR